jgi:cyclopropane fatty-acyl-phospholipid synthase-like methyltransferase
MTDALHRPGLDDLYASPPPWDIDRPQPAFAALAAAGDIRGRVLDVGCGTGEHALLAGGLGLPATGIDLAESALRTARGKARDRGLPARFLLHDARQVADLGETFDTVLDCGLFHVFTGADRAAFAGGLRSAVEPGGRYFMLGFSDRQSGYRGPHRLTRGEIVAAFTGGWRIDSLAAATIEVTTAAAGIPAWLLALTRI